uniref:LOV domain-containing protein n=1 Tax=Polyblepharides amylifera TaxID=1486889 RepID=A0A7R9XNJ7_9CHLO|mmetsp:Transcript_1113/g.1556  ORF Transcript_1113/g.1556 Transcript_1113/m.1556 type:complete len:356 (+) Transcript_1113:189-1256(+)
MRRTKPSGKMEMREGEIPIQRSGLPNADVNKALDVGSFVERQVSFVLSDPTQEDCPIVLASPGFFVTTGYSQEEVLGRNCRFLQGPDTDQAAVTLIREAVRENRECHVELLNYRKDGTKFNNLLHVTPIFDGDQVLYFMGMQLELPVATINNPDRSPTAEKGRPDGQPELPFHAEILKPVRIDGEGQDASQMMQSYKPQMQNLVVSSDPLRMGVGKLCSNYVASDPNLPDCPIIFASEGFLQLTGYTSQEVIGRNCRFLQGFNTNPATVRKISTAVKNNQNVTAQILNYKKDGTPFWNMLVVSPVWRDDRSVAYFIGVQMDISTNYMPPLAVQQQKQSDVALVHSMLGQISVNDG